MPRPIGPPFSGSTVALTDANGDLAASYRYDSFGNLVDTDGIPDLTRFRYTGAYQDHTGLYKIGHRYYNPTHGRWTQQDPVWNPLDPGQWNRYLYVGADPANYVDMRGLCRSPLSAFGNMLKDVGLAALELGTIFVLSRIALGKAILGLSRGRRARATIGVVGVDSFVALTMFNMNNAWQSTKEFVASVTGGCGEPMEVAPGPTGNPYGYATA